MTVILFQYRVRYSGGVPESKYRAGNEPGRRFRLDIFPADRHEKDKQKKNFIDDLS